MARILLLDDEAKLLQSMKLHLTRASHDCVSAETIAEAREKLVQEEPDIAIIDIRLPDGNGLDLVKWIRSEGNTMPIVILTAFGSIPNAVSAMREGTNDYIEKPVDLDQLAFIVERNLETERLRGKVEYYERIALNKDALADIIGESESINDALVLARRVAAPGVTNANDMPTVLITGETGTGKDVFARYIHNAGPLVDQPFVHVDCASLPRELIESELFGHERGAFTDARKTKKGLLELAFNGTVFLNEVGELPLDLQVKLLTTLERKLFRRVGGTRDIKMEARIIAATNADLNERVKDKSFREDLYYRLNVFSIHLPPLRERGRDVILLAEHFTTILCNKYRNPVAKLSDRSQTELLRYPWPGNVRELRHMLERATLLAEEGVIEPRHLGISSSDRETDSDTVHFENLTLSEMERKLINHALEKSGGNVSQAARILGITRGALRRRLESVKNEEEN